jgi:hypothetical protein
MGAAVFRALQLVAINNCIPLKLQIRITAILI